MKLSFVVNKALREKYPYSEFFLQVFSCNRHEYGEIPCISPHSVRMRENTNQKNSEYGHFHAVKNRCLCFTHISILCKCSFTSTFRAEILAEQVFAKFIFAIFASNCEIIFHKIVEITINHENLLCNIQFSPQIFVNDVVMVEQLYNNE